MRPRYLDVALWSALTVWTAVTRPWIAPGFAALAVAQGLLATFWLGMRSGRASAGAISGFASLSYAGLAYLLASFVGTPETAHFWLVFGVALAILAPVVVLALRLLHG